MKRHGQIDEVSQGSAPVPIAVKPLSQTRCQPDANTEQKRKKGSNRT
jgi:hypothetical protein